MVPVAKEGPMQSERRQAAKDCAVLWHGASTQENSLAWHCCFTLQVRTIVLQVQQPTQALAIQSLMRTVTAAFGECCSPWWSLTLLVLHLVVLNSKVRRKIEGYPNIRCVRVCSPMLCIKGRSMQACAAITRWRGIFSAFVQQRVIKCCCLVKVSPNTHRLLKMFIAMRVTIVNGG